MSSKLYVGNLSFDVTENDLRDMLSPHGPVNEVNVIMDRETGRARGFAFATMNTAEGAKAAILALNGKDWKGRALTVNEARPREERGGDSPGLNAKRPRYLPLIPTPFYNNSPFVRLKSKHFIHHKAL